MSAFRLIQPAPQRQNEPPVLIAPAPRRARNVGVACQACRKSKVKCDAARPACGLCHFKGRECQYREARKDIASRAESLEQLFEAMRTGDDDQASDLLRKLRADHDVASLLENASAGDGRPKTAPTPRHTPQSDTDVTSSESSSSSRTNLGDKPSSSTAPSSAASPATTPLSQAIHPSSVPTPELITRALDAFFSCSGKLFHVFTRAQVAQYHAAAYREGAGDGPDRAALCCLLAAAAFGAQYASGDIEARMGEAMYNGAKHHLDAVIEEKPMDAIKVCTLLAMYNLLNKATVALAYLEVGLSMCRRVGLDCKTCQQPGMSQATWLDYRRSWRTLIFCSNWLSSTLGYVSGNDILSNKQATELELDPARDLSDMVQNELVKIAFLKANMLRIHLAFKELTARAIESLMDDMQAWYRQLPRELHLTNLGDERFPLEAKRSLCHMHLLYLGATMLLYRRIASQYALSPELGPRAALSGQLRGVVARYSKEAIVAAKHSMRILRLLQDSESVFQRCWLVIFQSHTACLILLHSACQKQIHGFPPDSYDDELEKSQIGLSVLSFCGTADPVARRFHLQLSQFHAAISRRQDTDRAAASQPTRRTDGTAPGAAATSADDQEMWVLPEEYTFGANDGVPDVGGLYLLSMPADGGVPDADAALSRMMLTMLCRPFGDAADRQGAGENVHVHWTGDPTRWEYPQMIERLEWGLEEGMGGGWETGGRVGSGGARGHRKGDGVSGCEKRRRTTSDVAVGVGVDGSEDSTMAEGNGMRAREAGGGVVGAGDVLAGPVVEPPPKALRLAVSSRFLGSSRPSGWDGREMRLVKERAAGEVVVVDGGVVEDGAGEFWRGR